MTFFLVLDLGTKKCQSNVVQYQSRGMSGIRPKVPNFKKKEACAICLEIPKRKIGTLEECGHSFCLGCIIKWLETGSQKCPMCNKTPVTIFSQGKEVKIEIKDDGQFNRERFEEDRAMALRLVEEEEMMLTGIISAISGNGPIGGFLAAFLSIGFPELSGHPTHSNHEEPPIFNYDHRAAQRGLISPLMEELDQYWPTEEESKTTATRGTRKGISLSFEESLSFPILTRIIRQTTGRLDLEEPKSVWLNLYLNGNNYAPWHQDSYGGKVAIVSIGGTRLFKTRPVGKKDETETYNFGDGDVIFFNQTWNETHQHSISKTKTKVPPRISIVLFW